MPLEGESGGAAPARGSGVATLGELIRDHSLRGRSLGVSYDEDRDVIRAYIEDFAREFADRAPLKSSTTRAYNLYRRSGLERDAFIERLYAARAVVKERIGGVRSVASVDADGLPVKARMAYYFEVLADQLNLRSAAANNSARTGDER